MIASTPAIDPDAASTTTRFRLGRLGPLFLVGQLGWAIPGAASATLLQALAASIAPADKIGFYTLLTIVGAIASTVGTIVGGTLSDRTRSRFGKRSPWLIGAALVAAIGLAGTGLTDSLPLIIVFYAIFQAGIGTFVAALAALLPDRVPSSSIGRASAFAGFGYLLGQTIGGVFAGALVTAPHFGLIVVPWTIVIAAVLIAVFVRGTDNRADTVLATQQRFLRDLVPPAFADFWLAFAARFLFILAIVMISLFQLFTLTDYLHLSTAAAGKIIGLATLVFGILGFVAVIVTGPLSDRIGRKKPFIVGAPLLIALALVPVLLAPSVVTYLVFFAIAGIGFGTYISVDQALMVAVLPNPETAARDLGFLSVGSTLPAVLAPLIGGLLAETFGYGAIFVASLVISILAAVSVVGIKSVR